jgi:XisI protein
MDKIDLYRNSIQSLLQKHSQHSPKNNGEVENQLLFDRERDSPIGDALRTIPINASGLARNEAHLSHHHAL